VRIAEPRWVIRESGYFGPASSDPLPANGRRGPLLVRIGSGERKRVLALLGANARAHPSSHGLGPKPFGLVMIESMAWRGRGDSRLGAARFFFFFPLGGKWLGIEGAWGRVSSVAKRDRGRWPRCRKLLQTSNGRRCPRVLPPTPQLPTRWGRTAMLRPYQALQAPPPVTDVGAARGIANGAARSSQGRMRGRSL